jgi:hypothetical protein
MTRGKNNDPERENLDFEAPDRLVRGLQGLQNKPVFVPRTIDEAILRSARQEFSKATRKKWRWPILIPSFGLAVAILLMIALWHHNEGRTSKGQFAREDINHDGQVDILDAFALARQVNERASVPSPADLNGDGVVDDRDVELITAHAVSLGGGGKS